MMFTGNFEEELTWKVADIWSRITRIYFHRVQVMIDADNQFVYISLPLDGSTVTNAILFGDYSNGLNAKNLKWSLWTFPHYPISIALDVDDFTKQVYFRYATQGGNLRRLDAAQRNDYNTAINTRFETAEIPSDSKGEVFHHGGVRLRVYGSGLLRLTVTTLDGAQVTNLTSIQLAPTPGIYPMRTFNAQSEKITIRGQMISIDEYLVVTKMWAFVRQLWLTRPAV